MNSSKKQVVIVDNATTCAMRIKALIKMHGASVKLINWGNWEDYVINIKTNDVCLLLIEQSVPAWLAEKLFDIFEHIPIFIILNGKSAAPSWSQEHEVSPISPRLSSFEIISTLSPFWQHDKSFFLPKTLLLADKSEYITTFSQFFSNNLIPFQLQKEFQPQLSHESEMVIYCVEDPKKAPSELSLIRQNKPSAGLLVYLPNESGYPVKLIQSLVVAKVDTVINANLNNKQWQSEFLQIWQAKEQVKEDQLVTAKIQSSLESFLEKNLIMEVLFATASDGVIAFDEAGKIVKFNEGFCELLGVFPQQIEQSDVGTWLSRTSLIQLNKILSTEHWIQQHTLDLEMLHEHKVKIAVSVAINRINSCGSYIFIAVFRNTTNQQLQTKLLMHKNAQLEHRSNESERQKKLMSDMSTKVSHKRNLFMEKLTHFVSTGDESSNFAPSQLNKLENLRLYYRIKANKEHPSIEFIDLAVAIDKSLDNFKEQLELKKLQVVKLLADNTAVQCCKVHLSKILHELLSNFVKYSQPRSTLTIETSLATEHLNELRITDLGPGIYEQKQVNLFDLYALNNISSDNELCTGLPLVHELMHLNGGEIYVEDHIIKNEIVGVHFLLRFNK